MAGTAPGTKLSLMGIILGMAARTVLRGGLQVCDCAGAGMACSAIQRGVFPGQLEGDAGMVKRVTVSFDPIVATQAVISISLHVGLHEISLDLLVACRAYGLVELDVTIYVAGLATKCRPIHLLLVGGERIPEDIV